MRDSCHIASSLFSIRLISWFALISFLALPFAFHDGFARITFLALAFLAGCIYLSFLIKGWITGSMGWGMLQFLLGVGGFNLANGLVPDPSPNGYSIQWFVLFFLVPGLICFFYHDRIIKHCQLEEPLATS